MAWQLPQCAKQNRAENRQKVECCPILLEQDPLAAQTPGTWQRLTFSFTSCVARVRKYFFDSEWTSCYCLGSAYLPSKYSAGGETGMGAVNNIVAGSVLVSHKYILPNLQHPYRLRSASFDNEETGS